MPAPTDDDAVLLLAAAGGDERAFERFYRRWLGPVTGFHLSRTGRCDLAFDLTAETFAAVVVACGSFDPARGNAGSWLFTIAANKLRDSARRGRVEADGRRRLGHEPIAFDDDDLRRVEDLASEASDGQVLALLGELPDAQREAVLARVLDERPYSEIAVELACSEAVIRQRVRRGLVALRTRMEQNT